MADTSSMKIKGFTVVPVKTSEQRKEAYYLYLKKLGYRQTQTEEEKPPERTVFVGNTPPWASESDFKQAFKSCGKVERVYLQHAPSRVKLEEEDIRMPSTCKKSHRVGYIVFKSSEAADKAIDLPYQSPLILKSESENSSKFGLARYKEQYLAASQFDEEAAKRDITKRIAEYDRKEKEEEEKAKNNEPDEEGWVTVTRVGKNKGAPRTEAEDSRVKMKDSKKRKRKELVNFYSFQNRERKKQRIEELREQFQKDKSAVEKMKKDRKFRPF